MTTNDAVLTRREGAMGVMTFNRPEQLNTLNMPMMRAIEAAMPKCKIRSSTMRIVSEPPIRRCAVVAVRPRFGERSLVRRLEAFARHGPIRRRAASHRQTVRTAGPSFAGNLRK